MTPQGESRYLLPPPGDERPDMRCVRVYVPDHMRYREALLGSISYLSKWVAWESDPLHRARLAADAWSLAIERTIATIDNGCECEPRALWDELPAWAETWEQAHADTIIRYMYIITTNTIDRLAASGTSSAVDWLWRTVYVTCGASIDAEAIVDVIASASPEDKAAAKEPSAWKEHRDATMCSPSLAGYTCAPGQSIYDWLDVAALDLYASLNEAANVIFAALSVSAQPIYTAWRMLAGARWVLGEGGAEFGGADEFGWTSVPDSPCVWSHTWDATHGDFANTWETDPAYAFLPVNNGTWTGSAWQSQLVTSPSAGQELIIATTFPSVASITSIDVLAGYPGSTYEALRLYSPPIGVYIDPLIVYRMWNKAYGEIVDYTTAWYHWSPVDPLDMSRLGIKASATNGGGAAGNPCTVHAVVLTGIGSDPWG